MHLLAAHSNPGCGCSVHQACRLHHACGRRTHLPVGGAASRRGAPTSSRRVGQSMRPQWRLPVINQLKDMLFGRSGPASPVAGQQADEEGPSLAEMDPTMVRLDLETRGGIGGVTEAPLGPLAVLLVGFMPKELERFKAMMSDMEADMVKVLPCTTAMLEGTLQDAMESKPPPYDQPPVGQRRAVIMSGMCGAEVVEVVHGYKEAGLPPTVFAAAVPNNWQRQVKELVQSVWADQLAMEAQEARQRANEGSTGGYAED